MSRALIAAAIAAILLLPCMPSVATADLAVFDPRTLELLLETGAFTQADEIIGKIESRAIRDYWLARRAFYAGDYAAAEKTFTVLSGTLPGDALPAEMRDYTAALAQAWQQADTYESDHFTLRAVGTTGIVAPYALAALEKAYAAIGKDLGYYPQDKIRVEVYDTKDDFAWASTLGKEILEKSGTVGICKFNRLMIISPQALPLGYAWLDTLAHEYTHLLVNRVSSGTCPLWLHEGIARYHDTRWRLEAPEYLSPAGKNQLADALKTNKLIPFSRMHPSLVYLKDQDEISRAFAEVSFAVHYIRQNYPPETVNLLLAESARTGSESAFRKVLKTNLTAFEKAWRRALANEQFTVAAGALSDQVRYDAAPDEEIIGADTRGQTRLGDRLRALGRNDAALAQYKKALDKEPANPYILLKAARAAIAAGDTTAAEGYLTTAITANPHYVTPYQVLGELYFSQNKLPQAATMLESSLSINPFYAPAHAQLGRCYLAAARADEARRELLTAYRLNPQDYESKALGERLP